MKGEWSSVLEQGVSGIDDGGEGERCWPTHVLDSVSLI